MVFALGVYGNTDLGRGLNRGDFSRFPQVRISVDAIVYQPPWWELFCVTFRLAVHLKGMNTHTIYAMHNAANGGVYVGCTLDFKKRCKQHIRDMVHGRHNAKVQADFNIYGEGVFTFEVLQQCPAEQKVSREADWMAKFDSKYGPNGYNVNS